MSETAYLDAPVLLAHLLGRSRAWVMAHPEASLTSDQESKLQAALERLDSGEPLPYVLEHWEFFGLDFILTPATLIPRPDTELLVEQALDWLKEHPERCLVVDVGTGSGCIAAALAKNLPDVQVLASDISLEALRVAWQNVRLHGLSDRVHCVQADLIPSIGRRFDLIAANLPYVPTETLKRLPVSRNEPILALDGGLDGLDAIRRLLAIAPGAVAPQSLLLIEIEASQGAAVRSLAEEAFPYAEVAVLEDLAGKDRLVCVHNTP